MFGFLKEKLKQTIERFTKKVDEATEVVEPTEEQKHEILKTKKIKKKITTKPQKIVDETYGIEIEEQDSPSKEKTDAKKHILHEKKEQKKEEKKGFFAKLKEKFVHAPVEEKKQEQE